MKTTRFTPRQKALLALITDKPAVITTRSFTITLRSVRIVFTKARAAGIDFSYWASAGHIVLWAPARDTVCNNRYLSAHAALILSGLPFSSSTR
jgi:hypothetical protein